MMKTTFLFSAALVFATSTLAFGQQTARVQVIHNSADVSISTVDVYVMGLLQYDDAPFRTATPFADVPAGIPLTIQVAPGNSSSAANSFYSTNITLEAGKTYIAVATGTVTDNGYTPYKPFNVLINSNARETAANDNEIDILLLQGITDLPVINLLETGVGLIAPGIPYGQFSPYLSREVLDYNITLTNTENNEVIGNYIAPFETLNLHGQAVTMLGSGFLDPSVNNNGPEFGLWMARSTGGNLIELSQNTASLNKNTLSGVSVYPNPAKSKITINVPSGSTVLKSVVYDMMGRQVATGTSTTVDLSGLTNGVYILKANIDGKSFEQKIIKN